MTIKDAMRNMLNGTQTDNSIISLTSITSTKPKRLPAAFPQPVANPEVRRGLMPCFKAARAQDLVFKKVVKNVCNPRSAKTIVEHNESSEESKADAWHQTDLSLS